MDHWVYKIYDSEHELIYVGVTQGGHRRLSEHSRYSPWSPEAASIGIEHFSERRAALDRELQLIREEAPRFNVVGSAERFPPEPGEVTAAYAAKIARCSPHAIAQEIRAGNLRARRGTRGYTVAVDDLCAWIESRPYLPRERSPKWD